MDSYVRCLRGDIKGYDSYTKSVTIASQRVSPFYKHDMYTESMHLIYCSNIRRILFGMYTSDREAYSSKEEAALIKEYKLSLDFLTDVNRGDKVKSYNIPRLSNIAEYEALAYSKYLFDIYDDVYINVSECDTIAQRKFMSMIGNKYMTLKDHAYIVTKIETMICLMYIQTPEHIEELYPYLSDMNYFDCEALQFDILCIRSYRAILRRAVDKIKRFGFIQVYKPIYNSANSRLSLPLLVTSADEPRFKLAITRANVMTNVFNARCIQIMKAAGGSIGEMPLCMICEDEGIPSDILIAHMWICPHCKQYVGHTKCLERYIDENTDKTSAATTTISCPQCLTSELF